MIIMMVYAPSFQRSGVAIAKGCYHKADNKKILLRCTAFAEKVLRTLCHLNSSK